MAKYRTVVRQAGEVLANHCRGLLHTLNPQSVVLTGPLGRHPAYCEGFRSALLKNHLDIEILVAHENKITDPASAASILALAKLVYSSELKIQPLLDNHQRSAAVQPEGLVL